MRFSIDTNVLVYATLSQDEKKHRAALRIMERAPSLDCVVTLQALGELFRTLTGKLKMPAGEATAAVHKWRAALPVAAADEACLVDAMDAAVGWYQQHRLEQKRLADRALEHAAYSGLYVDLVNVAYEPDQK